MSNDLQVKINNALDTIYDVLNETAIEIKQELKKKLEEEFGKNTFSITISRGHIKNFRNYVWVNIEDMENEKLYAIDLFYNDNNTKSSNFRTQFGRFQFWKDIIIENKEIPSPHDCMVNGKNVILNFLDEKSYDPKQAIYDGTYNLDKLVNEFITFYKSCNV